MEFMYYLDFLRVHPHTYYAAEFKEKPMQKKPIDSRFNKGRGNEGKSKVWDKRKKQKFDKP
jgi:hypothetical protein